MSVNSRVPLERLRKTDNSQEGARGGGERGATRQYSNEGGRRDELVEDYAPTRPRFERVHGKEDRRSRTGLLSRAGEARRRG